jgi:CO dehydrogenase maturation factor
MKRIIFTGKGGVGKTTILSNLVRLLALDGYQVLTIDCDPSMNLATSLGIPLSQVVSLAEDKTRFQEQMNATFHHRDDDDEDDDHYHYHTHGEVSMGNLSEYIITTPEGINLIIMGTIPYGGAGCMCVPIALVKQLVHYLMSSPDEYDYIFVDSQAGVEIFGRGLASEFDLTLVITEPTPKSLEVAKHGSRLARDLGVKQQVAVVNKVESEEDLQSAIRELTGSVDHIIPMSYDVSVKEADKKGELVLDYAPHAPVLGDIHHIMRCVLGVK